MGSSYNWCINVYISHRKCQVKPHSSPGLLPAAATAITQKNKSFEPKVKFRLAANYCKRVLEVAKLVYANKTKESFAFEKCGSQDLANCQYNLDIGICQS